jgi:hypothetical protein
MSRAKILIAYIVIDLLIIGGVLWCVFHHVPVSKYFFPAVLLFVLNGVWLVVMVLKRTPPEKR